VPDTLDTTIPDDDGLGDLNPPTVNPNYGLNEQPVVETVDEEILDPIETTVEEIVVPNVLEDPQEPVPPDLPMPPEDAEMPDQGVTGLCCSQRARIKPERLVPSFGRKSFKSTAAFTNLLVHYVDHLLPEYVLVAHHIMTQFSMKTGMREFKERCEEAVSKELSQLHFRDTFEALNPKELNDQERKQVLESHLFLKQKRDDTIKGRMAARGNKQRGTIEKQDASSPTASLESVLLTAVIDAKEWRDVAVIEIPNAFVTRLKNNKRQSCHASPWEVSRVNGKSCTRNLYQVCYNQQKRRDRLIGPPPQCPA
jgi:hypothetical protein